MPHLRSVAPFSRAIGIMLVGGSLWLWPTAQVDAGAPSSATHAPEDLRVIQRKAPRSNELLVPRFYRISWRPSPRQVDGRPTLAMPFPAKTKYRISCAYDCYQHKGHMHYGVDFVIPEGEPILAAADGVVHAITWEVGLPVDENLGDALIVYIDHGQGWKTRYVHLASTSVEVGDQVRVGQEIGKSGSTGTSAAHLHFELMRGESLHSQSVAIDDLFGGVVPESDQFYLSSTDFLPAATDAPSTNHLAIRLATAGLGAAAPVERQPAVTETLPITVAAPSLELSAPPTVTLEATLVVAPAVVSPTVEITPTEVLPTLPGDTPLPDLATVGIEGGISIQELPVMGGDLSLPIPPPVAVP